jgi:tRNA-dependent cyclodipeptide synthase
MPMSNSKKNIQYPPQTGPYKVFVKDKGLWRNYSVARLQISVGNPKHEGDKFFALTEWAAGRFDKVILIVSDTLQRHNLAQDREIDIKDAYDVSLLQGQKWLRDNKAAIENIPSEKCVMTLWDAWMAHPDFKNTYAEIINIYHTEDSVKYSVLEKAENFWARHDFKGTIDTSVDYILEELAAFAIMFKETSAIDIYPGAWFKEIFESIVRVSSSNLLAGYKDAACLRVDFTRNQRSGGIASMPEESFVLKSVF